MMTWIAITWKPTGVGRLQDNRLDSSTLSALGLNSRNHANLPDCTHDTTTSDCDRLTSTSV